MAFAGQIFITQAGKNLLAASQVGEKMEYLDYVLGDGILEDESDLPVNVISPKAIVKVTGMRADNQGQVILTGRFSNTELAESFVWREFALRATNGIAADAITYAYGYVANGETIPAGPLSGLVEKVIRYVAKVDNAENVTITVDGTVLGITEDQLFATINGMMYGVSEQIIAVPGEGWEQGEDMLWRLFVNVEKMTTKRGVFIQMSDDWVDTVQLVRIAQREGGIELLSKVAYEFGFELKVFVFDTFNSGAVNDL